MSETRIHDLAPEDKARSLLWAVVWDDLQMSRQERKGPFWEPLRTTAGHNSVNENAAHLKIGFNRAVGKMVLQSNSKYWSVPPTPPARVKVAS